MEELLKPKYFAPVNKAYWAGAVEVLVLSFLSIFPNLYFLYKAITNDRFIKRPVLRKTVLILSVEFALASVHACANSLIYLIPYHFNLPMTVIGCSWVRTIFYITLLGVFSSPFIIYIDRHFKIIHSRGCNPFLLALIACIINLPSFGFVFANKLDSTPAYIFDEACSYQHFSINFYIQKIQYLMMFMLVASPILASLMNVYTFAKLQKQNKVVSQRRAKEQRQLFVTLSIQALYPCICYLPSISLGIYGTITKSPDLFYIWRVTDALTYSSFGICVLLSVVFIQDFREMILVDLGLMRRDAVSTTPITVLTISVNQSQRRQSNKSPHFKKTHPTVI